MNEWLNEKVSLTKSGERDYLIEESFVKMQRLLSTHITFQCSSSTHWGFFFLSLFSPAEELSFGSGEAEKKSLIILNNVVKNQVAFKVSLKAFTFEHVALVIVAIAAVNSCHKLHAFHTCSIFKNVLKNANCTFGVSTGAHHGTRQVQSEAEQQLLRAGSFSGYSGVTTWRYCTLARHSSHSRCF